MYLNTIRVKDVRGYTEWRKETRDYYRELSVLSAAINYAIREWEWDIPNPVTSRKPKQGESRIRWISRSEADVLIRAAEGLPRATVYLALVWGIELNSKQYISSLFSGFDR